MNLTRNYNHFLNLLKEIKSSIAFYPAVITFSFCFLAILTIQIEDKDFTKLIFQNFPSLFISDPDTARGILNTLIGGIISLTVFSFSMVMILLNQASSNYSPRLLPGLITDKRHQFVLGTYLGSIVYIIICNTSIVPGEGQYEIPGLTILLSILLGIYCLGLFVYFIHNISQSIQITNILYRLFTQIKSTYEDRPQQVAEKSSDSLSDQYQWYDHSCDESGFLTSISEKSLSNYADQHQLIIRTRAYEGSFLMPGERLYQADRQLNKEQQREIVSHFHFSEKNQSLDTAYVGLKHITEVALKAMSPGINDPGTAQLAINYIIQLLALRMKNPERRMYHNDSGRLLLVVEVYPFKKILGNTMTSLRTYAAHDPLIVQQLMKGIDYLQNQNPPKAIYKEALQLEKELLVKHAKKALELKEDYQNIIN